MRLSCNFIVNYANVNQFNYQEQWQMRAGDPVSLYFQIIDLDQNSLRHLVGIGTNNQPFSVVVTCPSIDTSKQIQVPAIQVDPNDTSLWKIVIAPTQFPGSGNVIFAVIEGNNRYTFKKINGLAVELAGADGSC